MPFDPYFAADGEKRFTSKGVARAEYTAKEWREINKLLDLPLVDRTRLNCEISERLRVGIPVTRVKLAFHNVIKRMFAHRSRMPVPSYAVSREQKRRATASR